MEAQEIRADRAVPLKKHGASLGQQEDVSLAIHPELILPGRVKEWQPGGHALCPRSGEIRQGYLAASRALPGGMGGSKGRCPQSALRGISKHLALFLALRNRL